VIYTVLGLTFLLACASIAGFAPRRATRAWVPATLAALIVAAEFVALTQR
jgi:hypothetical protein